MTKKVVYDPAKLIKMKANHNYSGMRLLRCQLFMTLQS